MRKGTLYNVLVVKLAPSMAKGTAKPLTPS